MCLWEAGADGFEVLLPLGAGLFLTGMKWFSTPGVEVRLGFAAMEVEISGEAAIKSCTPLVEFLGVFCLSITIPLPTGPAAGITNCWAIKSRSASNAELVEKPSDAFRLWKAMFRWSQCHRGRVL